MLFLCSIIANRWGLREAKNRIKMIDISIEKKRIIKQLSTLPLIAIGFFMSSCYSGNGLDESRIDEFCSVYFEKQSDNIEMQKVALYVDNSTCIANAMNDGSDFYNEMVRVLTSNNIGEYYSIRGPRIILESGNKYQLLKSVKDTCCADIKEAAERIANGNCEGILLTDGEYYQHNISKSNPNNPWMETAIVKWLSRGHEIFVFAEPYIEKNNGKQYNKKRYYFVFTDTRYDGNIYNFIVNTITLKNHPQVGQYRLTANHYTLLTEGNNNSSKPNEDFMCTPTHCNGRSEVQIWNQLTWKDIYKYIACATTDDGTPLPDGEAILSLVLDRNSGGSCFRISDVDVRICNLSEEYQNFCMMMDEGQKPSQIALNNPIAVNYQDNFIKLDKKEFNNHGKLDVYFDVNNFDPSFLNTKDDNLLKIDFVVSGYNNNFKDKSQAEEMFTFPSIEKPGELNTSLVASIRNALADPSVKDLMKDQVIYSVYIFSGKNNM